MLDAGAKALPAKAGATAAAIRSICRRIFFEDPLCLVCVYALSRLGDETP